MLKSLFYAVFVLVVGAVLIGCEKVVGPDDRLTESDIATLKRLIDNDPLYTNDPVTLSDYDGSFPSRSMLQKSATPIIPRAWARRVVNATRNVEFERESDTTVVATVTFDIDAEIKILAKYSQSDTAFTVITKPAKERTIKKIRFARVHSPASRPDTGRSGWRPLEVSAVEGGTVASSVTITKLEVTAGGNTITITNPLNYFMQLNRGGQRSLVHIGQQQEITVRVTITSTESDTDWVSIHRPQAPMAKRAGFFRPAHHRMMLVSQTQTGAGYERVYEAKWSVFLSGRTAFFVNALTRSSLYDDAAPYSSDVWGIPFVGER